MNTSVDTAALDRVLEAVTKILTRDVVQAVADMRADAHLQARLDELASKSTEGRLTDEERHQYEDYVDAINLVGIL